MFVSYPKLELDVPVGLGDPESLYWRGIGLTAQMPWFMATLRVRDGDVIARQTMCLCWDTDLAPLLKADDGRAQLISLQRLVPSRRPKGPAWELRNVSEVWVGHDSDAAGSETLIFRDDDGTEVCGCFGMPVAASVGDRRLVRRFCGGTRRHRSGGGGNRA